MKLADIAAVTTLAKSRGVITVVDNTLATPYLQKPLELGADIVIHSSAKYLSGDSNIIGGALATNDLYLFQQLQSCQNILADSPEPYDCFRILKGMLALSTRVQQQEKNAKKIVNFLSTHSSVEAVHYPGLPSHPQHVLACRQMSGFGYVIGFELKGGTHAATQLLRETRLFALREKTNNVDIAADQCSAISSTIAHAKIPLQVLTNSGANSAESLVRLVIGLENVDDLIKDLSTALKAVNKHLIEFPAENNPKMSLQA